jgi:uridine kinase
MQQSNTPFIIGVTGGSGSGKTTLIKRLRQIFPENALCVISQDEYYKPRHEQWVDANGYEHFDLPTSIDDKAFQKDIQKLLNGEVIEKQEYVFNNKDAKPIFKYFRPAPIIIVEGLFVFHYPAIKAMFDLKLFVYAEENLKIIRRIRRDQVERGYPIEDVLYRYEHHIVPSYQQFIEPYLKEADLIFNNNQSLEPSLQVLTGYLNHKLNMKF